MKTPSELINSLVTFIKHLYHADATSSAAIHWWWFKRLIDFLYRPTRILIYIFNYIPPFSWAYHAVEGIFGKNGYIGVGSVAGLYIAIYGVAQSSNQDELDRQERAIAKYERTMKLSDEREKMHGMRGLVKLSSEAIQQKPVFKCPIKHGDCPSYWFELKQHRIDLMAEELRHFYSQCHKDKNCGQSKPLSSSDRFDLNYLTEDLQTPYLGFNDFDKLKLYVSDIDYLYQYPPSTIAYQMYSSVVPIMDLKSLTFKNLDLSRWQLYFTRLDNTLFDGVQGEYLDMRNSVYRRLTITNANLTNWVNDGSLIYSSRVHNANLSFALLTKGVSFVKSTFSNSHLTFAKLRNLNLTDSSLLDTTISVASIGNCASRQDIDFDAQTIKIDDIKQLLTEQGLAAAQAHYRQKLSCNMILPNGEECRFIARNRCLNSEFQVLDTHNLTIGGRRN